MSESRKMLRIIRIVTTVTDVDLSAYFDFPPPSGDGVESVKRPWTAEEAIAYERDRARHDQVEALEVAIEAGEITGLITAFDVITSDLDTAWENGADVDPPGDRVDIVPKDSPRYGTPMAGLPDPVHDRIGGSSQPS